MTEAKASNTAKENSKKDETDDIDEDKQAEAPLLDSVPETKIKQPKKMSPKAKKSAAEGDAAGGGDSSMFDITLDQLKELMQERGKDLMEKLKTSDFNGVKGILEKLKVDGNKGLDGNNEEDLEQRRAAYGRNEIPPKPMKSFLKLCWEALHDMLLIILLVCAVVSIGLSFYRPPQEGEANDEPNLEWIEGVAILVAVLVVVFVTAFNDWRKERQFRGLESKIEKDQQTSVVRDNSVQQIPVNELVVGDLCFIKYGDLLPADGLIVQSSDLKIDESSITGETDLIKKSTKEDVGLLSGTHVMEGSGRMLVTGVGLNSQVGSIMSLLGNADDSKDKDKKGKDKKKGGADSKKKETEKKPKPISSKVAPDQSPSNENETNAQTAETVNETKKSSVTHPRVRKLPELKQASSEQQETTPTKTADANGSSEKKSKKLSSSSDASDDGTEKKSDKTNEDQTEKPTTTASNDEQKKKTKKTSSSSNDSSDNDEEKKKPTKDSSNDDQEAKTSNSGDTNQDKPKKKSSSNENSDNDADKAQKSPKKTKSTDSKPEKQSSPSGSENEDDDKPEKTVTKTKTTDNKSEKQSSPSGSDDDEQTKKSKDDDKQEKTVTKTKSIDSKPERKSSGSGSGSDNEEQEKKLESAKQKEDDDRPTTTSAVEAKVSDDKEDKSEKKKEDGQDPQKDSEKKPAALSKTAEDAQDEEEEQKGGSKGGKQKSVLQAKLTRLALIIGYIGMAAAVLTLIALIIRFCITTYVVKKQAGKASDVSYFISFLIQAITVVVVSVPEGLPLAVTLALAYAVRKMMTDNNLVRHLDACETMGNASTICSDKTGTLTTNRMTVVQCYINEKHSDKLPKTEEVNKDLLPLLFEAVTVNSNYTSKIEKAKEDEGGLPKQVGNKTECALLDLILKWGGSYDEIRKNIPEDKLVKVYTFNSARKMMSTIIQRDEGYRLYTKGASEMVLTKCKSILDKDNKPKDLNDEEKKKITKDIIEKMANDGLRTICIAYKDLGKEKQNWDDEKKIINDLICIGIVGIEDPVREEVPEAIEKCQKAGVVVRMVTGDNIMTARSIATKCGIIKPEDDFLILEGKEFNKRIRDSSGRISQRKLDEVWPKLRVLARSSPQDKYNLVNGIVESRVTAHREVVAVTGDGTNDGPALKRADVGFAMGIQGTDVAKQASDIILTDDNFSSIVKAMMWGRNVYDCIAKFLQFQLTANLSAGVISVISAAAISAVPLRAVQMLWVNLVMDTLASLALATEPPTESLLKRKPYGRTKSIISPEMMRNILGQSLYQLVIMFIILYAGQYFLVDESTVQKIQSNPHAARELSAQFTMVFNAFVLMTLFNEINSRKLHSERNVFQGIHRNPFFYGIWLFCFCAQILIVTFGDKVFSCARLDIKQWAWSLAFGVGSLIWQQILLFVPIAPFSRCFAGMYRICCPCLYKRSKKKSDDEKKGTRKSSDESKKKSKKTTDEADDDKSSKSSDEDDRVQIIGDQALGKYPTVGQLTRATVVMPAPPIFARYMLRKSVDRLNNEFRVINAFRSRLEEVKEKTTVVSYDTKRNS